ncbi:ATP-binding protein [Streptomyces sp. NPDC091292]|uniref:ATP-binding protein n=1 Tax=Streptomyces sp. NPDC091292 TaxID=3365991 RepID=UPI0037FA7078
MHRTTRPGEPLTERDKSWPGHARRICAARLRHWRLDSLIDPAVLLTSELVTNALQHGHGDIGLKVVHTTGEVRIEVTDGNPAPAQLTFADDEDVSGRGLFIVAALADTWGVSDNGRTTWAAFALAADPTNHSHRESN